MNLAGIARHCLPHHLSVMGAVHDAGSTVVLLGPGEPGFWDHIRRQPELQDGATDPLDRWSKRVIGAVASELGAHAIFPSDGPPYPPFISWALSSARCWLSPSGLLVHDTAGLMVSFRGALRLDARLDLPATSSPSPCEACASQPCRSACPVDALTPAAYDVAACRAHIRESDSAACRSKGCAARRACPVSQSYGRKPDQSAFHMRAFLGE
ncbi:MAG: ferredoxin [Pseudomonadota bacterium]